MEIDKKTKDFIKEHCNDDVAQLALKFGRHPDVDIRFAITQIKGMQKARVKLPELPEYDDIVYPPGLSMEQCSSSATARYKASLVSGESFADLTGGFGIDTMAFARTFKTGVYVEPDRELCDIFENNSTVLGCGNVKVVCSTMEDYLPEMPCVDMIYADPSRRDKNGKRVVELNDLSPNILSHKDQLLSKCKTLVIKLSPMLDITILKRQLPEMRELHIVAVNNECKELVCVIREGDETSGYSITAVNINDGEIEVLSGSPEQERQLTPAFADKPCEWLYEPNAAVMKSGLYNTLSHQFDINKLAPNTNLFTSMGAIDRFPGRRFKVLEVLRYRPKENCKELESFQCASVAVRNFPVAAEELRKSLKIKDGNDRYIFGTTLLSGEKVLVVCNRE